MVDAIYSGDIIPLYKQEILCEYNEVLHRKKFSFSEERIQKILLMIRHFPKRDFIVTPSEMTDILYKDSVL